LRVDEEVKEEKAELVVLSSHSSAAGGLANQKGTGIRPYHYHCPLEANGSPIVRILLILLLGLNIAFKDPSA